MLDVLKEMILDFQELHLDTGIPRRVAVSTVPGKATVCLGVRRCGKSTFLFQLMRKRMDAGVSPLNILYLNFFDDRLHRMQQEDPGLISEAYFSLYPEKKNAEKVYCFFDEIQMLPGWERLVDRLMRTEKCEVYLTGSSAQMLSREIATQMRGRALSWEMFPFSFLEFLDFKGVESEGTLSSKKRLTIQKAFGEFWESGGFPEVLGLDQRTRIMVHQEYFHAMLFRDLVERHDIAHPRAVTDLARWLADNPASLYSINNLTGYLKSLGHKVPKSAVADYLGWFEDAYVFFTVRIFDASVARVNTNPKKVYAIDHSLVRSVSSGILVNSGHLLENLVFTALRRLTPEIFYYKTKSGREVDFIAGPRGGARMLVQACESIAAPQTRLRETAALEEAMTERKLSRSLIVTKQEDERIETASGVIEVVPAWRFLLEHSPSEG